MTDTTDVNADVTIASDPSSPTGFSDEPAPSPPTIKFTVDRDEFADAVTWASKNLPQRPIIPVLSGVTLTANADGTLDLAVYDLEISSRASISAQVELPGTFLVSGKYLSEIARSLPPQPVDIELVDGKVGISCGASRFALQTMPVEEFPDLPIIPDTTGVVDASTLSHAVSQVNIAASKDDTLPILTSIRLEIEGERVTLLATDRYRLAVRQFTWTPRTPDLSAYVLVRGKTFAEVAKAMSGDVQVALAEAGGKEMLAFSTENRVITTLLVEGDYPKVRSLFPNEILITAVLEVGSLREAVRRVSLVAERQSPIKFEFADGTLVLRAGAGDDAQATEALQATINGGDITTGFNPHYMAEGLAAIDTPYVRFSMTEARKPVVISGVSEPDAADDPTYRYLLMPILRY